MNKQVSILVITVSVSLILLLGVVAVNHSSVLPKSGIGVPYADGMPMPPPPPPKLVGPTLVADGAPMPPPPKPKRFGKITGAGVVS